MDLIFGVGIVLAFTGMTFAVGWKISRKNRRTLTLAVGVGAIALLAVFLRYLWDSPLIARLLPFSNVIVVGNFQPPLVGLLAGLAAGWTPIPSWRRATAVSALLLVSQAKAFAPLLSAPLSTANDQWSGDVCLQSTDSTCSAAAAATLLRAYGIAATESEMTRLCCTTERGTSFHGLYRGLSLKTSGTPWKVRVLRRTASGTPPGTAAPLVLTVGLRRGQASQVDSLYSTIWGWREGVKHTIVFFGYSTNGDADIGDPSVGRETWGDHGLDVLWQGEAIGLVRRD